MDLSPRVTRLALLAALAVSGCRTLDCDVLAHGKDDAPACGAKAPKPIAEQHEDDVARSAAHQPEPKPGARACDGGDANACYQLGLAGGAPIMVARAFNRACDGGIADGCNRAARLTAEPERAQVLAARGCELGSQPACELRDQLATRP